MIVMKLMDNYANLISFTDDLEEQNLIFLYEYR